MTIPQEMDIDQEDLCQAILTWVCRLGKPQPPTPSIAEEPSKRGRS